MGKKQRYLILLLVMVLTQISLAQTVTITGKVTSKIDGQPLPGANVIIKGESQGSVTDFDGNYTINGSQLEGKILSFSYIGYSTISVALTGKSQIINVSLEEDATSLDEVVVTALGIKRASKALGYSLTTVNADDIGRVKTTSAINALQGKVAGVNISQNSTGAAGSSRVIIRGASSLSGSNQPLYIIDGVPILNATKASIGRFDGEFGDGGDDISSINPDDIESVSVLKGSSAAALYGSQASNGVIMITTKSGKGKQGFGVEFSSSLTFDSVNTDLQDFQTTYGQGRSGLKPGFIYQDEGVVALDDGTPEGRELANNNALSNSTQAWGTLLDGTDALAWDGVYRPYTDAGNNIKKFYNTGITSVNTVSLVQGSDDSSYRISASNLDNKDVFPNSTLNRKSLSFNGNAKINTKLTSTINIKYIIEKVHNRVGIGDGPGNANNSVLLLPRNVDVTDMKPGYNEIGAELPFTSSVWTTNPYWVTEKFNNNDKKNRLIASSTLRYDITDWLYLNGRAGIDSYDLSVQRVTPWGTAYRSGGRLYQSKSSYNLFDADVMLGIDKALTDKISTNSVFGGNTKKSTWESLSAQGDDFVVVGLEDLNNTTNPIPNYGLSESKTNSLYASIEVDYDNIFFLTYTGRNEWFSTLSFPGKTTPNHDFYQSISGSFLLHEAFELPEAITFAKLRSSYAQVAGGTNPYALNLTYAILGSFQGQAFGTINGGTIPNPNLVPLEKKEFEIGFDGRFFNNRMNLDVAYYSNKTLNDIVRASATFTSGYTSALLNVGELENKGLEFLLGGSPIKSDEFTWNTSINIGYNNSEIVSTNDEGNPITMQLSRTGNANIAHIVGENYGTIVGESYARNDDGIKIYTIDGQGIPRPVRAEEREVLGDGVAPISAGFSNGFRYKNISLNALIDGKFGGQVFSGTNEAAYYNGSHKRTLEGRENGLEVTGIDEATGLEFTTTVPVRSLGSYYGYIADENTGIAEEFIYDTDFIKLRELSLGYSIPKKFLDNNFLEDVKVSLIGRNLFYLMKKTDNIDPEASINNTNSQGLERFGVPATRSLGFSLNVKF